MRYHYIAMFVIILLLAGCVPKEIPEEPTPEPEEQIEEPTAEELAASLQTIFPFCLRNVK